MNATADLWASGVPENGYERIYARLGELRELFHSHGRLDDSNAKLDEVIKLLATYLAYRRRLIASFPALRKDSPDPISVPDLQRAFQSAASLPCYSDQNGESVFGSHPRLALQDADGHFAGLLVDTVVEAVNHAYAAKNSGQSFDLLNEAFGHFVRDNFRSNIEDAQYLTPPEVVDFMVDVAIQDVCKDSPTGARSGLTILDPCCGVGSFLAAFSHRARTQGVLEGRQVKLFGQDKVQRMVRFSTINLALFDALEHHITVGNSLLRGSPLDRLIGSVDLILTNPPFGARFQRESVLSAPKEYFPLLGGISLPDGFIDSELLFIDRSLSLLKPGGRLLIVVPDGIVSAKGLPALLRSRIYGQAHVRMIVELPSVAFAQAGTRSRTVILYLQKNDAEAQCGATPTLMATCDSLGFEVTSRKGVQVKSSSGGNDLTRLSEAYLALPRSLGKDGYHVGSTKPSAVWVSSSRLSETAWTPSHFSANRFAAIDALATNDDMSLVRLSEIASHEADSRRAQKATKAHAYISILHVIGEGILDVAAAMSYCPKTPGIPVKPGEVLLSRINPRNPRVVVVPDLGRPILCSSEFEILAPTSEIDAYGLAFLLLSEQVTTQVASLATGTSASHNRVRTEDLRNVVIPVPRKSSRRGMKVIGLIDEYRHACKQLASSIIRVHGAREGYRTTFQLAHKVRSARPR